MDNLKTDDEKIILNNRVLYIIYENECEIRFFKHLNDGIQREGIFIISTYPENPKNLINSVFKLISF